MKKIKLTDKKWLGKFQPRNEEQRNAFNDPSLIKIYSGAAGSGKTFLACAEARAISNANYNNEKYTNLRLMGLRAMQETGRQRGEFKGYYDEKIEPFIRPLKNAFEDATAILASECSQTYVHYDTPEFFRGETLNNCLVVIDEAQNIKLTVMKMLLTRLGENCRVWICGDPNQSDLVGVHRDSMQKLLEIMSEVKAAKTFKFKSIVRGELTKQIATAFEKYEENHR